MYEQLKYWKFKPFAWCLQQSQGCNYFMGQNINALLTSFLWSEGLFFYPTGWLSNAFLELYMHITVWHFWPDVNQISSWDLHWFLGLVVKVWPCLSGKLYFRSSVTWILKCRSSFLDDTSLILQARNHVFLLLETKWTSVFQGPLLVTFLEL